MDREIDLWVEGHAQSWEGQPPWTVVDPEGRVLGMIETPPGLLILEIGSDYLLGSSRDELGVERIVMHRLVKG